MYTITHKCAIVAFNFFSFFFKYNKNTAFSESIPAKNSNRPRRNFFRGLHTFNLWIYL